MTTVCPPGSCSELKTFWEAGEGPFLSKISPRFSSFQRYLLNCVSFIMFLYKTVTQKPHTPNLISWTQKPHHKAFSSIWHIISHTPPPFCVFNFLSVPWNDLNINEHSKAKHSLSLAILLAYIINIWKETVFPLLFA